MKLVKDAGAVYEFTRKPDAAEVAVKKNGVHHAKVSIDRTGSNVFRTLYERNGFEWWGVLAAYTAAGSPERFEVGGDGGA